jgi:class 3 adenylate cyclase/tetratricopeptide (TPR) repeat protein
LSAFGSADPTGTSQDRRKLIAVLYADMVGYSRLIGLDDQGTLGRLRALRREVIDPAVEEHGGRVVQTGGDSLLIVFDSIDGAVRCAVKVQQRVPTLDRDCPPDRAIRFRVGVEIGDAIPDGTDLHGDAVNIAARLQAECPAGGICISRSVRDHVHGRLDLAFERLGTLNLKNIARPVEAFVLRIAAGGEPALSRSQPWSPNLPRPRMSVLVAPIQSYGFAAEDELAVQGVSEDVAADLSQIHGTVVCGCGNGAQQAGDLPRLRETARELGVCYVIHGSIRMIRDRVALNIQLVRAESGVLVWAERFQAVAHDLANTHDEITGRLVRVLSMKLIEDVDRRIAGIDPRCWTSDDLSMRGRSVIARSISASNRALAIDYFERALEKSANCRDAKIGIAGALIGNLLDGWSDDPEADRSRAETLLSQLLEDDADNAVAQTYMGMLRRLQGRLDDSRSAFEIAIARAPNSVLAIGQYAITLLLSGDPAAALPHIERCLRLAPHDPNTPVNDAILGWCKLLLGRVDKAVTCLRRARASNPRLFYTHAFLAAALALNDEPDEATAALREAIALRPQFGSQSDLEMVIRESTPRYLRLWGKTVYAGLIRAGLPQLVPHFAPLPAEFLS